MDEKKLKEIKDLQKLKEQYDNIPIPRQELKQRILSAIEEEKTMNIKKTMNSKKTKTRQQKIYRFAAATAAAAALIILPFNLIEGLAATVEKIPILGTVANVVTFRQFTNTNDDNQYSIEIEVPELEGLENSRLETTLNENYLAEGQKAYTDFLNEIGSAEPDQLINRALDMGFEIIVNENDLLVIMNYKTETAGSSSEKRHYDTIDTNKQILLSLSALFKDDTYIQTINQEIRNQMKERAAAGEEIFYTYEEGEPGFQSITKDQTFYINKERKLVISFDEYEIAPGYMGTVEFIIPTETIADQLTSNHYIK